MPETPRTAAPHRFLSTRRFCCGALLSLTVSLAGLGCGGPRTTAPDAPAGWPLSADRSVDWRQAGMLQPPPVIDHVVDFDAAGGRADGDFDNTAVLRGLLAAIDRPTVIQFGPGDYRFNGTICISIGDSEHPLVLRGAGADQTHFRFAVEEDPSRGLIRIEGAQTTPGPIEVLGTPRNGDRRLRLASTEGIHAGASAVLSQQNNLEAMGTYLNSEGMPERHLEALATWARRSVGQAVVIEEVTGSDVILRFPLTLDYAWGEVRLDFIRPRQFVGLEAFSLHNQTDLDGLHTIVLDRTANCWVSGIESHDTVKMHLVMTSSRHNVVRDSLFVRGFRHGGGGHGYGVVCARYTNHCLIENNAFAGLRHSMMVKEGANANVFAYNFSTAGFQEGSTHARDISLHGHYPFMNLFEGNVVEYIHSTDYWGAAGPGNTFFRNRVTAAALQLEDFSPRQNAIGNDLPTIPAQPTWLYRRDTAYRLNGVVIGQEVIDPLVFANRHPAEPTVARATAARLPASLYLDGPPSFWDERLPWPAFGPGTAFEANLIPAQVRWEEALTGMSPTPR